MEKLSEKKYWDSIYQTAITKNRSGHFPGAVQKVKEWLKHVSRDYSNYMLWEVLYPRYFPQSTSVKVIEVGCAPAGHLVSLHKKFGYTPFGVEYSEAGCVISRDNFKKNSLPPENIVCADFFDQNFQEKNVARYDMVVSLGFIEHFDDVPKVVDDHMRLVSGKGYVTILIPNLRGINYFLLKFLNPESLSGHNFSIMNKKVFTELFDPSKIDTLYCDYVGTFSFGLLNTDARWKYYIHRCALLVQRPVDAVWRVLFGKHHMRNSLTSPYLLFIGQKK